MMKINNSVVNGNMVNEQAMINKYVLDPNGILTGKKGLLAGVYGAFVVVPPTGKIIPMYIGETGKAGRCIKNRIQEHLKYWLGNPEFYCGVKKSELDAGTKYLIKILAVEFDGEKRYQKEQELCETMKPYLQCGVYPKFDSKYRGFDLCIFPTYRRRAFVVARDGFYHEEKTIVDKLNDIMENYDFSLFMNRVPSILTVENVEYEMPKGSDIHLEVKELVECNLGITSIRGCNYKYLVRIVSAALECVNDYYVEDDEMEEKELSWEECFEELDIPEEVLNENVFDY